MGTYVTEGQALGMVAELAGPPAVIEDPLPHPAKHEMQLEAVLHALSDPMRLRIVKKLLDRRDGSLSCSEAAPCADMAKSTLSHHFRILRDAGLIRTTKQGVENLNSVRWDEVNERFPGLLKAILKFEP
jgi:DNA-binding transcriptional ArsR family regulator